MAGAVVPARVPVRVSDLAEGASCSCWVNGAADPIETFQDFESRLSRACKKAIHSRSVFAFKVKDLVVVKDDKSFPNEVWHRGEVRCVFENSIKESYRVFLVDYGKSVVRKSANVIPCPPQFADYPHQARLVRLYGLFPATIDVDLSADASLQLVRADQWTWKALHFVRSLIDDHDYAYFIPERKLANRQFEIFGDIQFEKQGKTTSLSKELIRKEYALKCPDEYEKVYYATKSRAKTKEESLDTVREASPKSQPVAPKQSLSPATKKTVREMFDEARKLSSKVSNESANPYESESSTGQSTEKVGAEVIPADSAIHGRLNAHGSSLTESPVSSSEKKSPSQKGKTVPSPGTRTVSVIPAGWEIVSESKNAKLPRIVYKAQSSSGGGQMEESAPKTSPRQTSDSEPSSTPCDPSKTASDIEQSTRKTSSSTNTLLKLLGRNKSKPTSSNPCLGAENNIPSDNATGGSAHASDRPASLKKANILEILKKKSPTAVVNVRTSSCGNASCETISSNSSTGGSSSVCSPPQVSMDATVTPVLRLEKKRDFHVQESILDRKKLSRVLVHGGIFSKPWRNISEAKFHPVIKKALTALNVDELHALQQHAWPVIKKKQNVVMIGRKTQGKLLSYVAPVMDFVLEAEKPEGNGPLAIILCPGYNQTRQAYSLCKKMISSYNGDDARVLMFHDSTITEKDSVKCLNGCEVLVTTPRCFVKLVQFSTNLHRLGLLVLDHADMLLAKFVTEVKGVMTEVKEHMRRQKEDGEIVQIVVSSSKWIPLVHKFSLKFPDNPAVMISCPLEAAVYADPQVHLRIVKEREKIKDMLGILQTVAGHQRVVVFCSSPEEVDLLYTIIKTQSLYVLKTSDNSTGQEMEGVKSSWDDSGSPHFYILICTDAEFLELDIRDATCLIHYSMLQDCTKTQFGARFSCLMANYPSLFKECIAVPTVYILLDETNDHQLPGVVNFMQRLQKGTENLLDIATEAVKKKEREKRSNPLCLDLQMFGDCWDSRSCEDRHILLPDVDTSNLPKSGHVKLKILHTVSACHFTARVLAHSESGVDFTKWPNEYVSVAMKMAMRYNDPANRMEHGNPKVGDICAVNSDVSLYHRAVIVTVMKEERKPTLCDVRLLDDGVVVRKKAFDLLYLPEELQVTPPQAVDIFVCRLKPKDLDDVWSNSVTDTVEEWVNVVNSDLSGSTYFEGKVVLSLKDKIWVDPLEVFRNLQTIQKDVITRSFRRALLEEGLAEDNPGHMTKLYSLCEQCGFQESIVRRPADSNRLKREVKKQQVPQWAHLDLNTFELTRFICGESPHLFYVRRVYTEESFDALMKEIQPIGEKTAGKETVFRPGRLCLAFCSADKQWARAMMQSTVKDGRVLVFFVDDGDTEEVAVEFLAGISDDLIAKLPFQAIECGLVGIKAKGGKWTDEAYFYLGDVCGRVSCMYSKPVDSSCAQVTAGKHYKILLVDTCGDSNVLINDAFVNDNIAEFDEDEKRYLVNPFAGPISGVNQKLYDREDIEGSEEIDQQVQVVPEAASAEPEKVDEEIPPTENHGMVNGYQVNFDNFAEEDIADFLDTWFNPRSNSSRTNGAIENGKSVLSVPAPETARECREDIVVEDASSAPRPKKQMPSLTSARAPLTIWYQDLYKVWIDVCPGAVVEDYYLSWTLNRIQFSACDVNGKYYYADLPLCGVILQEELSHCRHGLTITIAAQKACTGWKWPRLLCNPISPKWLRHDSTKESMFSDSEDELNVNERLLNRAHKSGSQRKRLEYKHEDVKFEAALSDEDLCPEMLEDMLNDDQFYSLQMNNR